MVSPKSDSVSVIITCYNQARFLSDAIESVRAQERGDCDLLVVDDGSTDDTAEVAARHKDVRVIRQENRGLAAARNTGLHASSGDYLVFLDADDRLLPNALNAGVSCLNEHPECAFVYGRYYHIAADGSPLRRETSHIENADYAALLRFNVIGMHATVMYRRPVLESLGGFDTSFGACEDYELYLRITRGFPISSHRHTVAEYRIHDANMTRDPVLMLKTALAALGSQREHIESSEILRQAYREGMGRWRNLYGEMLVEQVRLRARAYEWRRVLRGAMILARHHPRGLFANIYRKVRRTILVEK